MDFLIKNFWRVILLSSVLSLTGCYTVHDNKGTQNLTNNKSINNIHLRYDEEVDPNANKIQVQSFIDAEIFEVPKKLNTSKGKLFKRVMTEYLDRQASTEKLTATINIYHEEHLPAAKDLMLYLQGYGIEKQYIQIKTIPGGLNNKKLKPREVLLKTEYYKVYTPKCPNWENVSGEENSNFGCATAVNLAVHVSNPRDLIIGRKLAPIPSAPKIKQLEEFYKGTAKQNTGINKNNNQGNNQNNNPGVDNGGGTDVPVSK